MEQIARREDIASTRRSLPQRGRRRFDYLFACPCAERPSAIDIALERQALALLPLDGAEVHARLRIDWVQPVDAGFDQEVEDRAHVFISWPVAP